MKLIHREKENTELLITTGFILVVLGLISLLHISVKHVILSGLVIIVIGGWKFIHAHKQRRKKK